MKNGLSALERPTQALRQMRDRLQSVVSHTGNGFRMSTRIGGSTPLVRTLP